MTNISVEATSTACSGQALDPSITDRDISLREWYGDLLPADVYDNPGYAPTVTEDEGVEGWD